MSLADFADKVGMSLYDLTYRSNDLPCYLLRFSVEDEINTRPLIKEYIKLALEYLKEDEGNEFAALFSITTKDRHYRKWLNIAKEEGYQIIPAISRHGPYKCWSIIVPRRKLKA